MDRICFRRSAEGQSRRRLCSEALEEVCVHWVGKNMEGMGIWHDMDLVVSQSAGFASWLHHLLAV